MGGDTDYAKLMRKRDKALGGAGGEAPRIDMDTLRASARASESGMDKARMGKVGVGPGTGMGMEGDKVGESGGLVQVSSTTTVNTTTNATNATNANVAPNHHHHHQHQHQQHHHHQGSFQLVPPVVAAVVASGPGVPSSSSVASVAATSPASGAVPPPPWGGAAAAAAAAAGRTGYAPESMAHQQHQSFMRTSHGPASSPR